MQYTYMHRTTILLPENLQAEAEAVARSQGVSLGELIRRQLQSAIKRKVRRKRSEDPLFKKFKPWAGPGPTDMAIHHDEYLYGKFSEFSKHGKTTH